MPAFTASIRPQSLDKQVVSDTMKTALGIEDEGDVTWEQYVRDTTRVKQLAITC